MVNLFGNGFVGGHFSRLYPCVINARNDLIPQISDGEILYTISTIDNYNLATDPYVDIDTNLTTLIRVLENCRGRDITFNFVSSWFVYGDIESPYRETALCNPRGFYSITKRTAEQLMIEYCNYYRIPWRIMRLANVIGPGDRKVSVKKNILTYLIRRLRQNQTAELHHLGQQSRDYIDVRDVARAIDLVINSGNVNDIYNIGTGISTTLKDVVEYAATKIQSQSKISYLNNGTPTSMQLAVDKLDKLGFSSKYTVFDTVDELLTEQFVD